MDEPTEDEIGVGDGEKGKTSEKCQEKKCEEECSGKEYNYCIEEEKENAQILIDITLKSIPHNIVIPITENEPNAQEPRQITKTPDLFDDESNKGRQLADSPDPIDNDAEGYLICLDILNSLVEDLQVYDFSSGSSDYYVPDSDESNDSTPKKRKKSKLARTSRENLNQQRQIILVPESDSETEDFWAREGIKNGRKTKPRKSLIERREDREKRKLSRNTGEEYINKSGKKIGKRVQKELLPCKRLKCSEKVPEEFRKNIFDYYWKLGSYEKRMRYVSNCIDQQRKKTSRMEIKGTRFREFTNKYVLRYLDKEYTVCKECFMKILCETNKFLQNVRQKMQQSESNVLGESTRGHHPNFKAVSDERLELVKRHILSYPAYESHYGRSNTSKKILPSHLNLTIMYEQYTTETPDPVSKTIYTAVFKAQNLSFKTPNIDTCLKCDTLQAQIKAGPDDEKDLLKEQLAIHQKAAEQVYAKKKKDKEVASAKNDMMVLTFDLQQCLPTPFLTTGAAFYKRQLWTYNLTIHDYVTNKAVCYMWDESTAARGGNEIASCIYHFILHKVPENIKHIMLFSDSCSGQNKNRFIIVMFLLAICNSHVESITHNFFVPGHTHMECDTDHALIEKAKKKTQMNIHHPRDWYQLVRNVSKKNHITVQEMTQNDFLDFAGLLKGQNALFTGRLASVNKEKFLLSDVKVFQYTKELFPAFRYTEDSETMKRMDYSRKRKKPPNFNNIPLCYNAPLPISKEKKADLVSLLPLIDVPARQFYIDLTTDDAALNIDPDLETFEENV